MDEATGNLFHQPLHCTSLGVPALLGHSALLVLNALHTGGAHQRERPQCFGETSFELNAMFAGCGRGMPGLWQGLPLSVVLKMPLIYDADVYTDGARPNGRQW